MICLINNYKQPRNEKKVVSRLNINEGVIVIANNPAKWTVGERADNPISNNAVLQGVFCKKRNLVLHKHFFEISLSFPRQSSFVGERCD